MRWVFLPAFFTLSMGGCNAPSMCELIEDAPLDGLRTFTCSATLNDHGLRMNIPILGTDEAFLVSATGTERIAI